MSEELKAYIFGIMLGLSCGLLIGMILGFEIGIRQPEPITLRLTIPAHP